jgi:phospholipase/lecithinase/hemolysin
MKRHGDRRDSDDRGGHAKRFCLALVLLVSLVQGMGPSAKAEEQSAFRRLVVLGDSLSDVGNAGRYSNGPVWVEYVGEHLGIDVAPSNGGGSNYAVGGARLDPDSGPNSLRAQADRYLAATPDLVGTLHIVLGGGNDLLAAADMPSGTQAVEIAAASLAGIVFDLIAHGATDVLVPNLPDVGITPAVRAYGPGAIAAAGGLSRRFNALVSEKLAPLAGSRAVRLRRLDIYAMGERVQTDPSSFGFQNTTVPCIGLRDCDGYLFWDQIHPTTAAHRRLAEAALELLDQ